MNFSSLSAYFESKEMDGLTYFCDGMLMSSLVEFLLKAKVKRCSFDFGSIATNVFQHLEQSKQTLFVVGAKEEELLIFLSKIKDKYPSLIVIGYSNGYMNDEERENAIEKILTQSPTVVLVGMGAGLQERFLLDLQCKGFNGTGFTCGGFIRQEATSTSDYYPYYVNRLNLRFLYRMYKEPHTINRYLFNYPLNLMTFLSLYFNKEITLSLS